MGWRIAVTEREFLVLIHVLLLVYWLGADLGQFVLSFWVRKPELAVETRTQMAKVMVALDLGPRIALVLMLPVGFTLADLNGFVDLGARDLAPLWVLSAIWLVAVVRLHMGAPDAFPRMRTVDMWVRAVLSVGLVALSVISIVGDGPVRADWVAIKIGIFGILVALGLAIRIAIRPFGAALGAIIAGGSTPETETKLEGSLRLARPLVVAIWVGLIAAAALGIAKP